MDASDSVQVEAEARSFLCLKCRSAGHIVNDCPLPTWSNGLWSNEYLWFFSPTRRRLKFSDVSKELCSRCQDLDVLSLLHEEIPFKSSYDLNQAAEKGSNSFRSLGMTGSIQFKDDCPLCCCLYAMTPNPCSPAQEVLVFSDSTMNRLSGGCGIITDTKEKLQYARCLLVALTPRQATAELSIAAHGGDALCIMEEDDTEYATTLGGRLVESRSLNTGLIEEWLSTCLRLHGRDCHPVYTEDLQDIRLIDVLEPRKVINYPYRGCEYVALSYVWVGVAQKSFMLGSTLSKLPQTIEDAIACVRSLGKRYLWVDSVCIDQSDGKEKRHQIGKMSSIYRGAYITLIALSCLSAETGLPRFASRMPFFSQLRCRIGGKRLVGLMPTLSRYSFMSVWGSRAWTLQEAFLSPRCLYLSDHQLYFECNVMQCCESLDQTRSWAHNLSCDSNPSQQEPLSWMSAQQGHGVLKKEIGPSSERFSYWGNMVDMYSRRTMSKDEDALNAFLGVLQCLETNYEDGFFWGLPVADFHRALLWRFQKHPTRREGFPSWSWAGWKATVWTDDFGPIKTTDNFPIHLQIWRASEEGLVEVFRTTQAAAEGSTNVGYSFRSDPISTAEIYDLQSPEFDLSQYPRAEDKGYLFVEAIVLHFIPDYSLPLPEFTRYPFFEYFNFTIGVTRCRIEIKSIDREINGPLGCTEQQFLLLARSGLNNEIWHHLLLVHPRSNLVERGTAITLIVPQDQLEVLRHLKPQKRRVVLC